MWLSGLEMTRVTSKSEELRLQGDQPHRGLHSAVGGIQGISPIEYHQLQLRGIRSHEDHFSEELEERMSSILVKPLCCGLQRRNHGGGVRACHEHLCNISTKIHLWPNAYRVTGVPLRG